ncbi:DUF417 family protein, partial [Aeromonas hydrophila]
MSIFDRYEFLVPEHGRRDLGLLRWALVIVFLWFGAMKFTAYEAYGIAPFIEHSPIMNWLGMFGTQGQSYFIGVIELSTGLVLILGAFRPVDQRAKMTRFPGFSASNFDHPGVCA